MSRSQSRQFVRIAVAALLASATLSSASQAGNAFGWEHGNQNHGGQNGNQNDGHGNQGRGNDPVIFSFATVGDSRQDPASPDQTTLLTPGEPGTFSSGATLGTPSASGSPALTGTLLPQDSIFLQNTKPFTRILRGIQREKPNLLFFNGDMIYGYGRPGVPTEAITSVQGNTTGALAWTDAVYEYRQYAFWRGIVAPLFETGTYVVPVPGNHETECKSSVSHDMTCVKGTHPTVDNENAYRDNLGDLVEDVYTNERFQTVSGFPAIAANGFTAATAPNGSTNNGAISSVNETELSYSFDIKLTGTRQLLHFVVINTDPAGSDATAPTDWLAQDLEDAKGRAAANHLTPKYFVFGHKPAFTYGYNSSAGSAGTLSAPITPYNPYAANGLDAPSSATSPSTLNSTAQPTSVTVKQANGSALTIATNVAQIIVDAKPQYVAASTSGSGSLLPVTPAPFSTAVPYPLVNLFWAVIAHYNATYFSGHEHIAHVEQFKDVTGGSKNTPYQVIVGSGGSPFDAALAANNAEPVPFANWQDRYYGWATVQVHRSGNVTLQVQGFTDGAQYNASNGVISKLGVETPSRVLYSVSNLQ